MGYISIPLFPSDSYWRSMWQAYCKASAKDKPVILSFLKDRWGW